jgi:hypothetical protein
MGNARAFNEGDPVPKSTVERFGLDTLGAVVPTGTHAKKLAEAAKLQQQLEAEAVQERIKAAQATDKPVRARRTTTTDTEAETGGNG